MVRVAHGSPATSAISSLAFGHGCDGDCRRAAERLDFDNAAGLCSVTTAVTSTGLCIFATLPVVETRWTFVISYGGVETLRLNDKRYTVAHGADLQQFLAVAQGRQALVELSAEDVQPCHRSIARVCQLPRAVTKKASHQSCVELLFFN